VKRWLPWLLLAAAASCTNASPPEPTGVVGAAITNGTADTGDPAVVAVITSDGGPHCSGTIIGPHTAITAAHCHVQDAFADYAVFVGSTVGQGGTTIAISDARADPAYDETTLSHDVTLLTLRDAAPVAPMGLYPQALGASFVGQTVQVVGFGDTAAGASDQGIKRTGTARVSAVDALDFTVVPAPSQPCEGDSGGAALTMAGGASILVGVVSNGDDACVDHTDFARVDTEVASFIDPYLASTAPGTASVGEACLYDGQCSGGPCLQTTDAPTLWFCGKACGADSDCPSAMRCSGGECRYALPSPGAPGWPCSQASDCAPGGSCVSDPSTNQMVCSVRCDPASAQSGCPSGFDCTLTSGTDFFCLTTPAASKSSAGCSTAPGGFGEGWTAGAVALLAGAAWLRSISTRGARRRLRVRGAAGD
jgi:V8-like Glu-specific endopeptidase